MSAWTQLFEPGPALLLLIALLVPQAAIAAPFEHDTTEIEYYPVADSTGCYYNFQHYDERDRIITNEPCLNCTCHNRMLMCYLRVCPFTKAIGQDCKVEKRADQCCPVITCPEVPVRLLPSTTESSTAVGHLDAYGCSIEGLFYGDGARVPSNPNNPCELCYCIRNRTACVMQQCTLEVEGCKPVYQEGVCCPVRYNCEHPEYNLLETTTRRLITTTAVPTTTLAGQVNCIYNNEMYADGALIVSDERCERCYCMKGDIVCAVQKCNPTPLDKVNCTALPPKEGQCCPDSYECEHMVEDELTTGYLYTTPSLRLDESTTVEPEIESKPEEPVTLIPEEEKEISLPVSEGTTVLPREKEGEVVQESVTIPSSVKEGEVEQEPVTIPSSEKEGEVEQEPVTIPSSEKEGEVEQEPVTIPSSEKEGEVEQEPVTIPSSEKEGEVEKEPVTIPSSATEGEIVQEPVTIPSSGKEGEVEKEPATIPSSATEGEIVQEPVTIPSSGKEGEVEKEPATIPSSEKEGEVEQEPVTIPSSEKEGEVEKEPATIPPSETEGEIVQEPVTIPSSEKEGEVEQEPVTIPSSEKEGEVEKEPATIPPSATEGEVVQKPVTVPSSEKEGEVVQEPSTIPPGQKEGEIISEPVTIPPGQKEGEPVQEIVTIPPGTTGGVTPLFDGEAHVTEDIGQETQKPAGQEKVTEHPEILIEEPEQEIPDQEINEIPEEHVDVTAGPHIHDEIHPEEYPTHPDEEHEGGSGDGVEQPKVTESVETESEATPPSPYVTEGKHSEVYHTEIQEPGGVTKEPQIYITEPESITKEPGIHVTEAGEGETTELPQKPEIETESKGTEKSQFATEKPAEGVKVPEQFATEPTVTVLTEESETIPEIVTEIFVQPEHITEKGAQQPIEPEVEEQQKTELPQVTTEHPHVIQHVTEMAPEIGTGLPHEMEPVTEKGRVTELPQEHTTERKIEEGETTDSSQVPVTEEIQAGVTQLPSQHIPKGHEEGEITKDHYTEKPAEETQTPQKGVTETQTEESETLPHATEGKVTERPEEPLTEETEKATRIPQEPVVSDETTETPQEPIEHKPAKEPHKDLTETTEYPEQEVTKTEKSELPIEHITTASAESTELPKEYATEVSPAVEVTELPKEYITQMSESKDKDELPKDYVEKEGEKGTEIPKEYITQVPIAETEATELPQKLTTQKSISEGESTEVPKGYTTAGPTEERTELPKEHLTQGPGEEITEVIPEHVTKVQIPKETELPKEQISEEEKSTELPQGGVSQGPTLGDETPVEQATHEPILKTTELPELSTRTSTEVPRIPEEFTTVRIGEEGKLTELPQSHVTPSEVEEGKTTESFQEGTETPQHVLGEGQITEHPKRPEVVEETKKPEYVTEGKLEEGKTTESFQEATETPQHVLEEGQITEHPKRPEIAEETKKPEYVTEGKFEEGKTTESFQKGTETPQHDLGEDQITEHPKKPEVAEETKKPEYVTEGKLEEGKTTESFQEATETPQHVLEEGQITEHPKRPEVAGETKKPEYVTEGKLEETTKYAEEALPVEVEQHPIEPEVSEKETEKTIPEVSEGETEKPEVGQAITSTSAPSAEGETERSEEPTVKPSPSIEEVTYHIMGTKLPTEQVSEYEGEVTTAKYIPEEEELQQPHEGVKEGTEKPQDVAHPESVTQVISEGTTGEPKAPEGVEHIPSEEQTEKPSTITEKTLEEITTSVATEKPETIETSPEHLPEEEHGIPGEGSCLVDGQTYKNNSNVPTINHCQVSCKCISSILQCESVPCTPPPSNLRHCMPVYPGPDSCCPTYSCTVPGVTSMESDSHMMETTTKKIISGVIGVDVIIPSEEGTVRPEGTTATAREGTELPEFTLPEEHVPYLPEHGTEVPQGTITGRIPVGDVSHITTGRPVEEEITTETETGKVTSIVRITETEIKPVTEKELDQKPGTESIKEGTTIKPAFEVEHAITTEYPSEEENIIDHTAPPYGIPSTHVPKEPEGHPEVPESTTGKTETHPEVTEHLAESITEIPVAVGTTKIPKVGTTKRVETAEGVSGSVTTEPSVTQPENVPGIPVVIGTDEEKLPETTTKQVGESVSESGTTESSAFAEDITKKPSEVPEGITTPVILPEGVPEIGTEIKEPTVPELTTSGIRVQTTPEGITLDVTEEVTESVPISVQEIEKEHKLTTEEGLESETESTKEYTSEKVPEHDVPAEAEVSESETEPSKEHITEQVPEHKVPAEEEIPESETEISPEQIPEHKVPSEGFTQDAGIIESITKQYETTEKKTEITTKPAAAEPQEPVTDEIKEHAPHFDDDGYHEDEEIPSVHEPEEHVTEIEIPEVPEKVTEPAHALITEKLPEEGSEGKISAITEPNVTEKVPETISQVTEKTKDELVPTRDEGTTRVPEELEKVTEIIPSEEYKPAELLPGQLPEVTTSKSEEVDRTVVPEVTKQPEHIPSELPGVTSVYPVESVTEKTEPEILKFEKDSTEKSVQTSTETEKVEGTEQPITEKDAEHTTATVIREDTPSVTQKVTEQAPSTVQPGDEGTTAYPVSSPEGSTAYKESAGVTEKESTTPRYISVESSTAIPEHIAEVGQPEKEGTTPPQSYLPEGVTPSETEGTTLTPSNVPLETSTTLPGYVPSAKYPEKEESTLPPSHILEDATSSEKESTTVSPGYVLSETGTPLQDHVLEAEQPEKEETTLLPEGATTSEKDKTTLPPRHVSEGATPSEKEGTTLPPSYVLSETSTPLPGQVTGAEHPAEEETLPPSHVPESATPSEKEGTTSPPGYVSAESTTPVQVHIPEAEQPEEEIATLSTEGITPPEKERTTLLPSYAFEGVTTSKGLPESGGVTEKEGTTLAPSYVPESATSVKEGSKLPPSPESSIGTEKEGTTISPSSVSEGSTPYPVLPESTGVPEKEGEKEGTTVSSSYEPESATLTEGVPETVEVTQKGAVSFEEESTTLAFKPEGLPESVDVTEKEGIIPSVEEVTTLPPGVSPSAGLPESTGVTEKEGIIPSEGISSTPPSYVPEGTTLSEGIPESVSVTERQVIPESTTSVKQETTRKTTSRPFIYIPPVYESDQVPQEGESEASEGTTSVPSVTEGSVFEATEKIEIPEISETEAPKITIAPGELTKVTETVVTVTPTGITETPAHAIEDTEKETPQESTAIPSHEVTQKEPVTEPSPEVLPGQEQEQVTEGEVPQPPRKVVPEQEPVTEKEPVTEPSQEVVPEHEQGQVTEGEITQPSKEVTPGEEQITEKEVTQPSQEALPGQEQVTEGIVRPVEETLPGQEEVKEGEADSHPTQEGTTEQGHVTEEEEITKEKPVTESVAVVTAVPGVTEQPTVPSVEGESKPTEHATEKQKEGVTEFVSPVSSEKPSEVPTTIQPSTESRPSIPGEGQELPIEQTSEAGVEGKPQEAFTSPTVTSAPRTNDTELFTSGPTKDYTTARAIPGELSTSAPSSPLTSTTTPRPAYEHSEEPDYQTPVEEEYDEGEQSAFGPGTCRYGGKVYVSAQQIPRDDPCDFCFCFRSDIICLQQSCPPPIPRCHEEPIRGFCCPRYECPVSMATSVNITTTSTTTTTTLPPHFLSHAYKGRAHRSGCQIQNKAYNVGEVIKSASGPCLHCTCGGNGQMKCDPKNCSPEPMLRQMIAAAGSRRRR